MPVKTHLGIAAALASTWLLACGGDDGSTADRDAGAGVDAAARMDAAACDEDEDGVTATACGGLDCDDTNDTVWPGAPERCNDVDDDCDGTVDEDLTLVFYADADGDGHGDPATERDGCDAPDGFVATADDCDDSDDAVHPGAIETCNDADDDCDGETDEGVVGYFFADADGDGFGVNTDIVEGCEAPDGYAALGGDCDDANDAVNPGATEVCDGADNDCDRRVDEGLIETWYEDGDGDGWGSATTMDSCDPPSGWVSDGGDCDDGAASVNPGATETCNGVDDDCDGTTDEGLLTTYYEDGDGDGWGGAAYDRCTGGSGWVSDAGDCNDSDDTVHPGATETCNYVDDDCDGTADEGLRPTLYRDTDHDGHGNPSVTTTSRCAPDIDWVTTSDDCDDGVATTYPGAPELCNGVSDDCDSLVDEGLTTTTFYRDQDGDGYGVSSPTTTACAAPPGYADNPDDCYDLNADAHPGQTDYPGQSGVCSGLVIGGCSSNDRGDGSYDYDCDGVEEPYDPSVFSSCGGSCGGSGWIGSVPGCGGRGDYKRCASTTYGCGSATRIDTCQCCN